MESINFAILAQSLIDWAVTLGQSVNDMPGAWAFVLGLFTWFLMEQIFRRLFSWTRVLVLIGVVVGLGFTAPYILEQLFGEGNVPDIPGLNLQPDSLVPDARPASPLGDLSEPFT